MTDGDRQVYRTVETVCASFPGAFRVLENPVVYPGILPCHSARAGVHAESPRLSRGLAYFVGLEAETVAVVEQTGDT